MSHPCAPLPPQHQAEVETLADSVFCLKMVQHCTAFVDELQRERGLGQLSLSTLSPCYGAALREQMHLSDEAEWRWQAQIGHTSMPAASMEWQNRLQQFWHGPEIQAWRAARSGLHRFQGWREEVFQVYGRLIHECLALTGIATDSLQEPFLQQELRHLNALMWCKEYCGQERALGVGLLGSGQYHRGVWQAIETLIKLQQQQASRFVAQARPSLCQQWHQGQNLETQTELEQLRHRLATHPEGAPLEPHTAETWFRVCSQRMSELREIERQHLENLSDTLNQRRDWLQAPRRTPESAAPGLWRTAAAWWVHTQPPPNGLAA